MSGARPVVSVRYLRVERVWCLLPYLEVAFPWANAILRLIGRSRLKVVHPSPFHFLGRAFAGALWIFPEVESDELSWKARSQHLRDLR